VVIVLVQTLYIQDQPSDLQERSICQPKNEAA
jgi:hypothetical protein